MSTRKDFLAASSLFALAAASPKKVEERPLTFTFDRARFEAILAKPAKHKQCFGATKIDGGSVLAGMANSISAYEDYLKEGAGAMHAVAVLYHGPSIFLAMNDAVWNELLTPFFSKSSHREDFAGLTLGKGNPFLRSADADASIEHAASKGSAFFVCHNAVLGFGYGIAHTLKMKAAQVHQRLLEGLVPAALAVPAGVMAINACQEAKFTYIQSSL